MKIIFFLTPESHNNAGLWHQRLTSAKLIRKGMFLPNSDKAGRVCKRIRIAIQDEVTI